MKLLNIQMIKIMLTLVVLFGVSIPNVFGAPTASHPRIWLDSQTLVDLRAAEQANTADWVEFKTWLDSGLDSLGYDAGNPQWRVTGGGGYRCSGYLQALTAYALGYQVLKNSNPTLAQQYGNYAVDILMSIPSSFKVGEEDNGLFAIRVGENNDRTLNSSESVAVGVDHVGAKNGYSARNIGVGMALVYDWCYDLMDSTQRNTISDVLYRYVDWYAGRRSLFNNGVLASGTRYYEDTDGNCSGSDNCDGVSSNTKGYHYDNVTGNFYSGNFLMTVLAGIATYGENANATTYYNYADAMVSDFTQKADSIGYLQGGDPQESWQYASGFFRDLQGLYAFYTSGANSTIFDGLQWPNDVTTAHMHVTSGNLDKIHTYGTWTANPSGVIYQKFIMYQLGVMGRLNPAADINRKAAWFYDNATFLSNSRGDYWENFLWATPIDTITRLPLDGNEPLDYLGMGVGLASFRETWQQGSDPVAGFVRLEGIEVNDKEVEDEGGIYLTRGSDRLLSHKNMRKGSTHASSIVFNRLSHYGSNSCVLTESAIKRHSNSQAFFYVQGDITNAYDKCQYSNPYADLFQRTLLYIRPNIIVVRDVTSATASRGLVTESFANVEAQPVITGNSFSVDVGTSTMQVDYLFPPSSTSIAYDWGDGFYAVANTPTVEQKNNQFIQVIGTGAIGSSPVSSSFFDNGAGIHGAYINNTTVVLFSDEVPAVDIHTATYTINATEHYITDLPINTNVIIKKDGSTIPGSPFNSGQGGVIHFTSTAGNANYSINANGSATCDSSHLNLCTTEPTCTGATGIWCGGVCQASTCTRADVDQSSNINSTDAMLTLRNSLTLDMTSTNWQTSATTGDANCDGSSNSTDAMLILRQSLGLDMSGTGWCVS